jgi:L-ascorbate metabolism protein UlaG (beta-lactamase superfamily)
MTKVVERRARIRGERIVASPLWSGAGFRNIHPILPGLRSRDVAMPTLREFLFERGRRVPDAPLPATDPRPVWSKRPSTGLRATWLGHSTVLVEIDGARILTDPVWGPRASPTRLVGPKRFQPVPVTLDELPPLDAIVISHDHYDHLDYPTIRALRRSRVPFIAPLGVGAHLERWGIAAERITELDWWESRRIAGTGVEVTAAPAQHFSGRGFGDRNRTLWASLAIRGPRHSVFFSGDTGLTTEYAAIRDRLGPFDLVMLEIGAFHPAWGDIHLGPANALEAHALLGGGALLPVHWGTFALAIHDWDEPIEHLVAAVDRQNVELVLPRLGEPAEPGHQRGMSPWWRAVNAAPAAKLRERPPAEAAAELLADPID